MPSSGRQVVLYFMKPHVSDPSEQELRISSNGPQVWRLMMALNAAIHCDRIRTLVNHMNVQEW